MRLATGGKGAGVIALVMLALGGGAAVAHDERPARSAEVASQVASAEEALHRGDAEEALRGFEQAGAREHALDIELGIVRSLMQRGHYRQAMAMAAHTSGSHGDEADGLRWYAVLLRHGGQHAFARRLLASSPVDHRPEDMAAIAPVPIGPAPQDGARVLCTALLTRGGREALAPEGCVAPARAVWMRNGLGRTARAEIVGPLEGLGLTRWRLTPPLDPGTAMVVAPRDPFPGTPIHVVGMEARSDARSAWPTLRLGFLGNPLPGSALWRQADAPQASTATGAPLFDRQGRLVGIELPQGHLMASAFAAALPAPSADVSASRQVTPALPLDEVYERALPLTLQVIAAP